MVEHHNLGDHFVTTVTAAIRSGQDEQGNPVLEIGIAVYHGMPQTTYRMQPELYTLTGIAHGSAFDVTTNNYGHAAGAIGVVIPTTPIVSHRCSIDRP